MWKFLLSTAGTHVRRMPYASIAVIIGFMLLFLTLFVGISLFRVIVQERENIQKQFTYPLAIDSLYTLDSQRLYYFVSELTTVGLQSPVQYLSREKALDLEIQRNPAILDVLAGENPLPDVIIVPLQGVNIPLLWQKIQEYRDLFETSITDQTLQARLAGFEQSLADIQRVWYALLTFTLLTGLLIVFILIAIIKYHLRFFQDEREVGRLVGADPVFLW